MINKLFLVVILSASVLAGCSLFDADKESELISGYLKETKFLPDQKSAMYVGSPSRSVAPKPFAVKEGWMVVPVESLNGTGGIPIHQAIRHTLKNTNLRVLYSDDSQPNGLVHVSLGGDVETSLNAISYASGQSYVVDGDVVNWTKYITKLFKVPSLNADYEYSMGNTSSGTKEGNSVGGDVSQSGGASTEFSSQKSSVVNAYTEFEEIANQVIGDHGSVVLSKSAGGVVVTTTLSRLKVLEQQYGAITKAMLRQIGIEIKLIRFTSNNSSGGAINWASLRDQANGLLQFNGGAMDGGSLNSTPISFSASRTTGASNGSELLVELLEKQGTVTVSAKPTITTQINRVARLDLTRDIHFVSRTQVQQGYGSSIGGSEPIASMEQSVVKDGMTIYVVGNISDDDNINLLLSSSLFDLESLTKKKSYGSEVESPTLLKNELSNSFIAANGETIIVGGLINETSKGDSESPTGLPFLKTKKTSETKTTELVVLLTPIIIEPPKRY